MAIEISIGRYYRAESIIHSLDPRIKITGLFLYIAIVLTASHPITLAAVAVFTFALMLLTHVPLRVTLKAILPLSWMLIFPFFINLFCTPDSTPLLHWGIILITERGLYLACFMTARLFLLLIGATVLTLTTSPIAMCDGVESMLAPFERFGVPAHEIAMIASIALRFIPLLLDEGDTIRKAQMARGAQFETGSLGTRIKMFMALLVPLFISAFEHAEQLALAMESRCYHGGTGRTHFHELKIRARDWIALGILLVALGLTIAF